MTPDRTAFLARLLREDAAGQDLSGNRLAKVARLPQPTVQRVLAGTRAPTLDVLLSILGALGRDLRWLHRQGVTPPPAQQPDR